MNSAIFDGFVFNVGWKKTANIHLFGKDYKIIHKIRTYFEEDEITREQHEAYLDYITTAKNKANVIERLLTEYFQNASERFVPRILLFEEDGAYALLCDDKEELDDGIAVCLVPETKIMSQDEYL